MEQLVNDKTFSAHESEIVQEWKSSNLYHKLTNNNNQKFVLMDGPPFVSGSLHLGHLSISNIKSTVFNYMQMNNNNCGFKLGYDCHGLPIENLVCKENGLKTLDQIKQMGTASFNELCDKTIDKYSKSWTPIFESIGRLADFNNIYMTRDVKFMETCIWIFKKLWNLGLIYKGNKVMAYSYSCQTPLSNFESSQNYQEIDTKSIYVAFQLSNNSNKYLVAWTTTPWTLPSNMALCVNTEIEYVEVQISNNNDNTYICSAKSVTILFGKSAIIKRTFKGSELVNITYVPLFDFIDNIDQNNNRSKRSYKVVADPYVHDTDDTNIGTGIVHLAPAFGEDDFRVCCDNNIVDNVTVSDYCPIDPEGKFDHRVPVYEGKLVFETEDEIRTNLKHRKLLIKTETIKHKYPHCYRTNTPLIYRTAESYYIKVTALRDRMVEHNKKVSWHPQEIGTRRFHEWLENAKDWAVSRFRFYGTPVPVWESENGDGTNDCIVIGSIEELEQLTNTKITNLHPQYLDNIIIEKNGKTYKRNSAILDCWFESGAVPFAQINYPFDTTKSKELESREFLSDLICEGLDQTRGWFYTLLVLSTAILDKPPFRHVMCTGLVLDKEGKKISKSAGNFVDPNIYINNFGADFVRLYLISSPLLKAEPLKFDEKNLINLKQKFIPLINGVKFFIEHALNYQHQVLDNQQVLFDDLNYESFTDLMDKWIVEKLDLILEQVNLLMTNFEIERSIELLIDFIEDLTNWYIKFNRDKFKGSQKSIWHSSLSVLYHVLTTYFVALAPFTPMLSEMVFNQLKHCSVSYKDRSSVLLNTYPTYKLSNRPSLEIMKDYQHICQIVRTLRCNTPKHSKVVIPLKSCTVCCASEEYLKKIAENIDLIKGELNCLEFKFELLKDNRTLKIEPNFKNIGKHFGKNSSEVIKFLESLDQNNLEILLEQNNIKFKDQTLDTNYFQIKAIPINKQNETNTISMIDGHLLIKIDHTYDQEICYLYQLKKLHSYIQDMRKEMKLRPWNKVNVIIDNVFDKQIQKDLSKMLQNADVYRSSNINDTQNLFNFDTLTDTVKGKVMIFVDQEQLFEEETFCDTN